MFDPQRSYTVDDYWKMIEAFPDRKYEYIDGHIRMMTGGSLAHAQLEVNLARLFGNALLDSECVTYGPDAILRLSEDRYYCPDLSVSCDPADWTKKVMDSPTVVVEVMSPSTQHIDKGEKLEAYQKYPTIQEILLVDSQRCYVKHFHRVNAYKWEDSLYQQKSDAFMLESLDMSLTLQDIYLKIYLELEEE